MPGLHNIIFASGGAALAQIHLFFPPAEKIPRKGGPQPGSSVAPGQPMGRTPRVSPPEGFPPPPQEISLIS